ncbi:MAG: MarR family winged helix-turn-helix transcriptional regulator [Jhaorihella sp.]
MPDFKQNSAGYLANHMARLFANRLHRRIGPLGLSPARFPVLLELWEQDGLTQSELVRRLDVEQATMANTLGRMERDGLIERQPSRTDRRARLVYLTPKARALQADAVAAAQAENRQALSSLSEAEQARFLDLMRRVIAAMQRQ